MRDTACEIPPVPRLAWRLAHLEAIRVQTCCPLPRGLCRQDKRDARGCRLVGPGALDCAIERRGQVCQDEGLGGGGLTG